jgi:hypothetical protein
MRAILIQLLLAVAASAFAQDCVPKFYNAEPRDSEWFYGAGKGGDAAAAREDALRHLAAKASGGAQAATDGTLAGWEQDDHGECGGAHYALVRIEQERVKRNIAQSRNKKEVKPDPAAAPTVVTNNIHNHVNNITLAPPSAERPYILLIIFLGFVVACIALAYRPKTVGYFYKPPSSGTAPVAVATESSLREKFKAAPRQTQKQAIGEIAKLGMPEYFRVHKGEGTCRPVPGTPDLLQAGVLELLRPYAAGGWKITWEDDAGFAVSIKDRLVMGFGFFLYASDEPGSTDCEILYGISAPIEDLYRNQMEEGLHQGLPWVVQAAAGRLSAAKSKEQA